MKILIVSTSDSKGGAARVAGTLVEGLRSRNHDVTFLVERQEGGHVETTKMEYAPISSGTREFGRKLIHRVGINSLALQSPFPRQVTNISYCDYDVIHLHDVPGPNMRWLPWLSRQSRLVWTIHSMAPFTGNCIYSYSCDRWKDSCGKCSQFGHWPLDWLHRDGSRLNLLAKKKIYRRSRIYPIGVSEWISNCLRHSAMGQLPIVTIHNAVPTEHLSPVPKAEAKKALGVSENAFAIAFSLATNIQDRRKGIDLILRAIQEFPNTHDVVFMPTCIGANTTDLEQGMTGAKRVLQPRHLKTLSELQLYYSAADIVWHPSRADNLPMVIIEAMSCGTPVIAANVGGVAEVIGDAGGLIQPESLDELITETLKLINSPGTVDILSQQCRQRAVEQFSIKRFLDDHEKFYHSLPPQTGRSVAS